MNIFNDAIEAHVQWKLALKQYVEEGSSFKEISEVRDSHACDLGRWIDREGVKYNRLLSFESMCAAHEEFHRAAAEVVRQRNSGNRTVATELLKPDGDYSHTSVRLVRALMDCSKDLADSVVKGIRNTGRVSDLLKSKVRNTVYSIDSSASIFETLKMMFEHNLGSAVVCADGKCVGIIDERTCLQNMVLKCITSLETPISDIVDRNIVYVEPDDSVEQCLVLMTSSHTRHLAVRNGGKIAGIISIGDVIKQVTTDGTDKLLQLEDYIYGHYGAKIPAQAYPI
jgi:CBS domain-containing protein